jgi:para-nitrobenzyl esterase
MLLAAVLTGCGSSNDDAGAIAPQDATEADLATTTSGYVRGSLEDGIFTFKGVRYGAPTGGDNRFRPPAAPAAWDDVQDATSFGAR